MSQFLVHTLGALGRNAARRMVILWVAVTRGPAWGAANAERCDTRLANTVPNPDAR